MVDGRLPTLDETVARIVDLRPMGAVATRILDVTESDDFSAHELAQVVATDQALTAKMLRLANSAYYGFPRRISTVRDAVVLLGFRAVRSTTLASCVIDAMGRSNVLDYDDFWHFSVTVGMLAELPARAARAHQHDAFTAGVMHNIGRLALDQHFPEALRRSIEHADQHEAELHDAQQTMFGFNDAELGGALALHWNFPEQLVDAVSNHANDAATVSPSDGLTAHVVRSRGLARSFGLADGLQRGGRGVAPLEWEQPPLSVALRQSGGIDGVLERVGAFLDSAVE